jgi:hypothetical protein
VLRGLRDPLDAWDAAWLDAHARRTAGETALPVAELRCEPEVVQGRLVRRVVERLGGVPRSRLGRGCVAEVVAAVARDGSTAEVPLPGGWVAVRRGAWLVLRAAAGG